MTHRTLGFTHLAVLGLFVALLFSGCTREDNPTNPIGNTHNHEQEYQGPMGLVSGKVMAPNGSTPIAAAIVFSDYEGHIFLTRTNAQGDFSLRLPVGERTIYIETGDGTMFRSVIQANVTENQTTPIPSAQSVLNQVAQLAYVKGHYDAIEDVVTALGYTIDELQPADLLNLNTLSPYSAIFLNCAAGGVDTNTYAVLDQYVANGGSLYASDWAIKYLIGTSQINRMANPANRMLEYTNPILANIAKTSSCAPRPYGFIPDASLCASRTGQTGTVTAASILNGDLQTILGATNMDVLYDLGGWEVLEVVGPEWEVLVADNSTNGYGPLLIRQEYPGTQNNGGNGGGNGGNNQWVTICHIPPGNPNNPITITISVNALQAHLNHGCSVGPCNNSNHGGRIYYTTFHNHPNDLVSGEVRQILEYVILNL